jgi:hypothetical protein
MVARGAVRLYNQTAKGHVMVHEQGRTLRIIHKPSRVRGVPPTMSTRADTIPYLQRKSIQSTLGFIQTRDAII